MMSLAPRAIPEIAGSQGGFIGLIVGLTIVILASCTAVFLLLRNHEPSDRERGIRRQLSSRRRALPAASGKLGALFGGGKDQGARPGPRGTKHKRKRSARGGHGWEQTGSGDEWDSDSDAGDHVERGRFGEQLVERPPVRGLGIIAPNGGPEDASFRPPYSMKDGYQKTSQSPAGMYNDPFSKYRPVTQPSLDSSNSLSSPTSVTTIERTASPEPIHGSSNPDPPSRAENHHFSTQSGENMRFEGGTKFREVLD